MTTFDCAKYLNKFLDRCNLNLGSSFAVQCHGVVSVACSHTKMSVGFRQKKEGNLVALLEDGWMISFSGTPWCPWGTRFSAERPEPFFLNKRVVCVNTVYWKSRKVVTFGLLFVSLIFTGNNYYPPWPAEYKSRMHSGHSEICLDQICFVFHLFSGLLRTIDRLRMLPFWGTTDGGSDFPYLIA